MNSKEKEHSIIKQVQDGDYSLFAELINTHQSSLYNFVFRVLYNRDDALDVCQDSFFKAYRSIKSFKFKSRFSTWLFQIAYNESVNYLRKHNRHREIEKTIQQQTLFQKQNEYTENIEKEELKAQIEQTLNSLKDNQRIALHLLYKEEKTYMEISNIMNLPVNTVKTHIRRGKENLRQLLENNFDKDTMLA